MTGVLIEESSDSRDIAHLVIETFAQGCYLSIHTQGSVKHNTEIAHTLRGLDDLGTDTESHCRQEVLKVIRDYHKELGLLLVELEPVDNHPRHDLINACRHL
jgi:hypothetical protein